MDPSSIDLENNALTAKVTFAIWRFKDEGELGVWFSIIFYVLDRSGPILLGDDILSQWGLIGAFKYVRFSKGIIRNSSHPVLLRIYDSGSKITIQTRFFVSSSTAAIKAFLATLKAQTPKKTLIHDGKLFAKRFHLYTHFRSADMK